MAAQPIPRIRRTSQNTQFTYNLSRRIHHVQSYPVLSPQGASIMLYGHDSGVTILWRGGRRFKPSKKQSTSANEKQNGAKDDAVMIIDSDDDEAPAKTKTSTAPFVDKPEFEDAPEENPYPQITQTLDLSLGTAVLHIATLPMTPSVSEEAAWAGAEILKEKMVFALSCATNEVYLVTLPLTPPSPESKARPELRANLLAGRAGTGQWGESLIFLAGQNKHSEGIAISLVKPKASATGDRIREQVGSAISTPKPRVVVASHTREASGTLRFWDVTLNIKSGEHTGHVKPFQTEYLPSPLTSISFNPTHMTQLLAVSSPHAVRIYDYALPAITQDDQSSGQFPSQGSWLLSLYQPFARPTATRKPILDAAWIAHGRAVFALLADGTWGIWDIDGASPLSATIMGKSSSGIRGGAITVFSASGPVEGASPLRSAAPPRNSSGGEFVPLTPHSRRDAAASLSAASSERLASVRGGVVVTPLPATGPGAHDEGLVLWIGGVEHVSVIPAVSRFWDGQLRKGSGGGGANLFSGAMPTRMIRLQDLPTGLLGERCCGVGSSVNFPKGKDMSTQDASLPFEVIVQGESRFVIVRDAEDGPGTKIGGVVSGRRRLFGDKGAKNDLSSAIIVQPRPDQPRNVSFNLHVSKGGSLRAPRTNGRGRETPLPEGGAMPELTLPTRPRGGFAFAESLSAAADVEDDVEERDVEAEMLDIMEIDRTLESMEDERSNGRKRAFLEDK